MASAKVVLLKKALVAVTAIPIFMMVGRLPYAYPGLIVYTIISLSTEALFSGFGDQIRRVFRRTGVDWNLPCRTWLWAVLVYGVSAAVSFPLADMLCPQFYGFHWIVRGLIFPFGVYAWEFYWGWYIETVTGKCPWEYQVSTYRIWRYIRPRYFLFWSGFGFVLEYTHLHIIHRLNEILPIVFRAIAG